MAYVLGLRCLGCGKEYPHTELRYTCGACGGFLDIVMDCRAIAREVDPVRIRSRGPVLWKQWREFLPVSDEYMERVSLQEHETPLLDSPALAKTLGVRALFIKNDTYFPSGSLKDRSMPIVVSKALEFGARTVCIMSAGNAASSLAMYAARAGLEAVVFMRDGSPSEAQLAHMLMFGARAVLVEDPREDTFFALRDKYGWYDCDGQVNPFRLEGKKTYAYAIWSQLGGRLPDRIVMTIGSGTGVVAAWKGLTELRELGWIDGHRLPILTGVQPEAASPIVDAFEHNDARVTPVTRKLSICNISPGDPGEGGNRTLQVLKAAHAQTAVASDADLVEAMRMLATQGLYVEPAGAVAMGGLLRLKRASKLSSGETVVVVITGHGLKQPEIIRTLCPPPIRSGSGMAEIERALLEAARLVS